MPIARGYSLDLYCRFSAVPNVPVSSDSPDGTHTWGEFPHQFIGETFGECRRDARKCGWVFNRDREVTCPKCASR